MAGRWPAFWAWCPPSTRPAETIARGGITHTGDGRLRSKLIQAAWVAVRKDRELHAFYRSVYRSHPPDRAARIAIVAVARKLSGRVAAVLRHQRPYVRRDHAATVPGTQVETMPQGTPRRQAEPGAPGS
jgi:transposase